jgi:hypothetical protein
MHLGDVIIDHVATPSMPRARSVRKRLLGLGRREPLPSLYDRHPRATAALRRPRGLQVVPLDRIVGTFRHPSQNTADFLPLPELRGRNWEARWLRIRRAIDKLRVLPAVELALVGGEYYVKDGHNRIAAALQVGAVTIDADVTELILPGDTANARRHQHSHAPASSILEGADELRQAAAGRQSRTAEHRSVVDELRREDLAAEATEIDRALAEDEAEATE